MQRRTLLFGAGVAAAAAASGQLWRSVSLTDSTAEANLTLDSLVQTLDAVCELVLPATETPGAKEVGVTQWLLLATKQGLLETHIDHLYEFEHHLNTAGRFTEQPDENRRAILSAIDDLAFNNRSSKPEAALWKKIKTMILIGYYTSEIGASQELHYELVPGRFLPDTPNIPGETKAWSSDWTAVAFG